MVVAGAAAALFFLLWLMLLSGGDEAPWVPAGLVASVVMLIAVAAREVVLRRAWTRHILEQDRHDRKHISQDTAKHSGRRSFESHSTKLRALQKRSAEADANGALPEAHLEAYHLCKEYLENTDETLRTPGVMSDRRITLRAGQDRVRTLQKHHLLTWARGASRAITHEAQLRARLSDKIETAMRALDVIESALRVYPDENDLHVSQRAVREFVASVKVAHWVELAERAAFKGHYRRAIDRYRDALFYVSREQMKEETRAEMAERIGREIELLRARLRTAEIKMASRVEASEDKDQRGRGNDPAALS